MIIVIRGQSANTLSNISSPTTSEYYANKTENVDWAFGSPVDRDHLVCRKLSEASTACTEGPHAVGRVRLNWVDEQRSELFMPQSRREVIAEVWYPAEKNSGQECPYFPELATVSNQLVEIGELSSLEAWGLVSVRSYARANANFATLDSYSPVIILSPGNATNVEFYSAIAEDLASHGYVVCGINHPYDVGAVRLRDGSIATCGTSLRRQ